MIWIFDYWTELEKNIYRACVRENQENVIVVLHDDGFLPSDVTFPYYFYTQKKLCQEKIANPIFADLLEVPDLWEIRMRYDRAEIWDEGLKKAEIDYAEPISRHCVKSVRWMMADGLVYKKDCYDKYGDLYYSDMLDKDERIGVRTYYAFGKPVLIYQPSFDIYTLLREGKICAVFDSTQVFLKKFLIQNFPQDNCIISNNIKIMEMVSEIGMLPCNFGSDVFILTNSDQIEHVEKLICALPMLHFHIGAKTRMSDKLLYLKQYTNVTLYQGISNQKKVELLIKSTYYLDINHYQEVEDIVYEACRYGLLIIGFDITLHNSKYVLQDCIFKTEEVDNMIQLLKSMHVNRDALRNMAERQYKRL